jgi:hypothetical protein
VVAQPFFSDCGPVEDAANGWLPPLSATAADGGNVSFTPLQQWQGAFAAALHTQRPQSTLLYHNYPLLSVAFIGASFVPDQRYRPLRCGLQTALLCTELNGGQHPAFANHSRNRDLLSMQAQWGSWLSSELGGMLLGHLLGWYDFARDAVLEGRVDQPGTLACLNPALCQPSALPIHHATALRHLRRHGFFVFPSQGSVDVGRLLADLRTAEFLDRSNPEEHRVRGLDPKEAARLPWTSGAALWLYDQNDCMRNAEVQRVAFDPVILGIVQSYLGAPPVLLKCDVWMNMPQRQSSKSCRLGAPAPSPPTSSAPRQPASGCCPE